MAQSTISAIASSNELPTKSPEPIKNSVFIREYRRVPPVKDLVVAD
jgi:hypothetical protein